MYRVTTPHPGYTGLSVGVQFVDGVGLTADDNALRYFRAQGYGVEPVDATPPALEAATAPAGPEVPDPPVAGEQPRKSASTEMWRTWAVEYGGMPAAEAAELTRDQLVERFTTTEETQS